MLARVIVQETSAREDRHCHGPMQRGPGTRTCDGLGITCVVLARNCARQTLGTAQVRDTVLSAGPSVRHAAHAIGMQPIGVVLRSAVHEKRLVWRRIHIGDVGWIDAYSFWHGNLSPERRGQLWAPAEASYRGSLLMYLAQWGHDPAAVRRRGQTCSGG